MSNIQLFNYVQPTDWDILHQGIWYAVSWKVVYKRLLGYILEQSEITKVIPCTINVYNQ